MLMLSQQQGAGGLYLPGPPLSPLHPVSKGKRDVDRLKKKVHQLEVESRVLLHENERCVQFSHKQNSLSHRDSQSPDYAAN